MDKKQAINLVKQTFPKPFEKEQFHQFVTELLHRLDDSPERHHLWAGQFIKKAYRDYVNHYERLGTYTDPEGRKLDVLVIHLTKDTTLERGRTRLRNFAADYLSTGHGNDKDAVLAAYVSLGEDDWRFSFVKLEYTLEQDETGKVKERKELTPARRYSFLVGANERSHTAQKQFLPLLENDQSYPPLKEIEEAFDIEKVTKEFFGRYRELCEKTKAALESLIKRDAKVRAEFKGKSIKTDDFAKKLLGQIVFLYFLQKKGWFGVERDAEWGTGKKDYLRHLFNTKRPDENYFNDILEPLFYNTLAQKRDHDYADRFRCKIPFLNGGLFEPLADYDWVHADILLPNELFSNREQTKDGDIGTGILDVFDRYNFTVNEAEPLETDVAVDPEMLGKVFENLLPENERHGKGTYYTPRVIVAYMCQQSLINYLTTHISEQQVPRIDLETFILQAGRSADFEANPTENHRGKLLPQSIRTHARHIDKLLEDITICDPAIGSGAFPVGMLQEIVRARLALAEIKEFRITAEEAADNKYSPYELKRHAIEKSIYGVDSDGGAVEIAKLRLWLSLVVDEEDRRRIKALPNLDYKISQGNSLLAEYRGLRLIPPDLSQRAEDGREERIAELRRKIAEKSQEFFILHQRGKSALVSKNAVEQEVISLQKELDRLVRPAKNDGIEKSPLLQQAESRSSKKRLETLVQLHEQFCNETRRDKKNDIRKRIDDLEHQIVREHLDRQEQELIARIEKTEQEISAELQNIKATLKQQVETPKLKRLEAILEANQAAAQNIREAQAELVQMDFSRNKPFFLWELHFLDVFRDGGGFNVVIGNPPYVRADSGEEHLEMRKAIERTGQYNTLWEKWDLYVAFIEQGYRLLRPNGTMTMIVSDAYCHSKYAQKSQNWFLRNGRVLRLDFLSKIQIFEAAVRNVIFFFAKTDGSDYKPVRRVHEREFGNVTLLPTALQAELNYRAFFPGESASRTFNAPTIPLRQVFYVSKGMVVNADEKTARGEFELSDLVTDKKDRLHPKPFVEGKHLARWLPQTNKWLEWGTERAPGLFSRPTFKEMYEVDEKLISVDMAAGVTQLKVTYDNRQLYHNHSAWSFVRWNDLAGVRNNSLKKVARYEDERLRPDLPHREELEQISRSFNVKYLLAVMNSNLARHFLRANRRSNIHLYPDDWKNLPIAIAGQDQQSIISKLVDYILFLKANASENESRDQLMISYFEQLVDALVYELYLPGEIHEAGKQFFAPLIAEQLPALDEIKGDKLEALRRIFERLYDRNHVIRKNIFFLDTIESVRIIEGKA